MAAVGVSVMPAKILLHLPEFLFFLSLLQIQYLHLSLKTALLFSQAFVFEFLLLKLHRLH
jgi:hypothetical protein